MLALIIKFFLALLPFLKEALFSKKYGSRSKVVTFLIICLLFLFFSFFSTAGLTTKLLGDTRKYKAEIEELKLKLEESRSSAASNQSLTLAVNHLGDTVLLLREDVKSLKAENEIITLRLEALENNTTVTDKDREARIAKLREFQYGEH